MNSVNIVCTLTRDPESRELPGGGTACTLRCVYNRKFHDKNNELREESVFFDTQVFGRSAINCRQFLTKGSKVAVSGRLDYKEWQSKDGSKRSKLQIVADNVSFLNSSQRSSVRRNGGVSPDYNPVNNNPVIHEETQGCHVDDDIPW